MLDHSPSPGPGSPSPWPGLGLAEHRRGSRCEWRGGEGSVNRVGVVSCRPRAPPPQSQGVRGSGLGVSDGRQTRGSSSLTPLTLSITHSPHCLISVSLPHSSLTPHTLSPGLGLGLGCNPVLSAFAARHTPSVNVHTQRTDSPSPSCCRKPAVHLPEPGPGPDPTSWDGLGRADSGPGSAPAQGSGRRQR